MRARTRPMSPPLTPRSALSRAGREDSGPPRFAPLGRTLVTRAFGPDEQRTGAVRAGDPHHEPLVPIAPAISYAADDVLFDRAESRRDAPALVDARVHARSGRPRGHPDRHHPRDIAARVSHRHARLEPCQRLQSETRQGQPAAFEAKWHDQVGIHVDDAETLGHDAHDLRGARFDRDRPPDDRSIASEPRAASSHSQASPFAARRARDRPARVHAPAAVARPAPEACRRRQQAGGPAPAPRCR